MKIIDNPKNDPEWPLVGLHKHDISNHKKGNLISFYTVFKPSLNFGESKVVVQNYCSEIANWIMKNKDLFTPFDGFQITIGVPKLVREHRREIAKVGGDWAEIEKISRKEIVINLKPGWDYNLI